MMMKPVLIAVRGILAAEGECVVFVRKEIAIARDIEESAVYQNVPAGSTLIQTHVAEF